MTKRPECIRLENFTRDVTCEANGCYAEAMFRIILRVETNHAIQLFLCKSCKPKFFGDGTDAVEAER